MAERDIEGHLSDQSIPEEAAISSNFKQPVKAWDEKTEKEDIPKRTTVILGSNKQILNNVSDEKSETRGNPYVSSNIKGNKYLNTMGLDESARMEDDVQRKTDEEYYKTRKSCMRGIRWITEIFMLIIILSSAVISKISIINISHIFNVNNTDFTSGAHTFSTNSTFDFNISSDHVRETAFFMILIIFTLPYVITLFVSVWHGSKSNEPWPSKKTAILVR